MSAASRLVRVVVAAALVVGIGMGAWWALAGRQIESAQADRPASPTLEPTETVQATATPLPPTAVPTATAVPTPTPIPTPLPFDQAAPLGALTNELASPLQACGLVANDVVVAGAVALQCIEELESVAVLAAASGRVVHIANQPAVQVGSDGVGTPGTFAWAAQAELGPHVVIDHGALGESRNTQTVYAGLSQIHPDMRVGAAVEVGQELGMIAGPQPELLFSVWSNDERQDGAITLAEGPPAEEQRLVAEALAPLLASPTDPLCPLVRSFGQLPGASRSYRNGTHRGIDFGCGAADRSAFAIADGTVVYLVDDYNDPSVAEREALLRQAGIAGFTPHWTLVMLYGNVVVIDHGDIPGAGRVVTIAAHLEAVDPEIKLGMSVDQGDRLGELGNRGTNASAQGIRGASDPSLHLHWEIFIDNWYLGAGLDPGIVSELVTTTLCGQAQTAGCPA